MTNNDKMIVDICVTFNQCRYTFSNEALKYAAIASEKEQMQRKEIKTYKKYLEIFKPRAYVLTKMLFLSIYLLSLVIISYEKTINKQL